MGSSLIPKFSNEPGQILKLFPGATISLTAIRIFNSNVAQAGGFLGFIIHTFLNRKYDFPRIRYFRRWLACRTENSIFREKKINLSVFNYFHLAFPSARYIFTKTLVLHVYIILYTLYTLQRNVGHQVNNAKMHYSIRFSQVLWGGSLGPGKYSL
jgi:hypothetical protein